MPVLLRPPEGVQMMFNEPSNTDLHLHLWYIFSGSQRCTALVLTLHIFNHLFVHLWAHVYLLFCILWLWFIRSWGHILPPHFIALYVLQSATLAPAHAPFICSLQVILLKHGLHKQPTVVKTRNAIRIPLATSFNDTLWGVVFLLLGALCLFYPRLGFAFSISMQNLTNQADTFPPTMFAWKLHPAFL